MARATQPAKFTVGFDPDEVFVIYGIAVAGDGTVYVSDRDNNRVLKVAPGASTFTVVAGGNGGGTAANQLAEPAGIMLDAQGNLYIADRLNNRVQKWARGATEGVTVAAALPDRVSGTLLDVGVDTGGNVYALDRGPQGGRVTKWAAGATEGVVVAGNNGAGSAPDQLAASGGLVLARFGNVFIADSANSRVQEWDITAPVAAPQAPPAGPHGWYRAAVSLSWNWSDSGGLGLDPAQCAAQSTVTATSDATATCADLAGNVGSAGPISVKIDAQQPVATPVVSGAAVTWNWSDAGSGLDSCSAATTSQEVGEHTVTATCSDLAGNTAEASVSVTVPVPPVQTPAPSSSTPAATWASSPAPTTAAAPLPATGPFSPTLLIAAGVLLATGVALSVSGRRRGGSG
jgi:LPXTG-motif cell wall-anchored protein